MYSLVLALSFSLGIFKLSPILKELSFRLFAFFNSSTEIPNFLAIPHSVSPDTFFM